MTPKQANELKRQVSELTTDQLEALWVWICLALFARWNKR